MKSTPAEATPGGIARDVPRRAPEASLLDSTDAQNTDRGAALEGAVLPAPLPGQIVHLSWGDPPPPPEDNAVYAAAPPTVPGKDAILPEKEFGPAPAGWIRDMDGNLWDAATVVGLRVNADSHAGPGQHSVHALTADGFRTVGTHKGRDSRQSAQEHCDTLAREISRAKGYGVDAAEDDAE